MYGTDYEGNLCGTGDFEDRHLTVYPRSNQDMLYNLRQSSPLDYKFFGVCVETCPNALDPVCDYNVPRETSKEVINACLYEDSPDAICSTVKDHCWTMATRHTSSACRRSLQDSFVPLPLFLGVSSSAIHARVPSYPSSRHSASQSCTGASRCTT